MDRVKVAIGALLNQREKFRNQGDKVGAETAHYFILGIELHCIKGGKSLESFIENEYDNLRDMNDEVPADASLDAPLINRHFKAIKWLKGVIA